MDGGDGLGAVVSLDQGEVRGSLREGVARFLAIPYAAAPSGDQRWDTLGVPKISTVKRDFQQMVETW